MMKGTQAVELDGILLADGCVLTAENIGHPLVQRFLADGNPTDAYGRLGAFQIYKTNDRGETLSQFLLRHGVDLLKNPNALNKNPDAKSDPITTMFQQQAAGAANLASAAKQPEKSEPKFDGLEAGLKRGFGKNGLF